MPRKEDPPAAEGQHSLPFFRLMPELENADLKKELAGTVSDRV
jgi:hypothetical protein